MDFRSIILNSSVDDGNVVYDVKIVSLLENFLIERYQMFKVLYYDERVRGGDLLIYKTLEILKDELNLLFPPKSIEEFINLTDYSVLSEIKRLKEKSTIVKEYVSLLERGDILRCVYAYNAPLFQAQYIVTLLTEEREKLEAKLSKIVNLPPHYLVLDFIDKDTYDFLVSLGKGVLLRDFNGEIRRLHDYSNISEFIVKSKMDLFRVYVPSHYYGKVRRVITDSKILKEVLKL